MMFDKNIKLPITIAIAEDNSFALKACMDKLTPHREFKVVMNAFNGQELIDNINKHQVDLVLMDIQMPGMNGIEAHHV
jgi:DNA-binding NarL/FixJ family response regulator